MIRHTEGEWEADGVRVSTPPRAEVRRRIQAREMPFDCKAIGYAVSSHYISRAEAEANALLFAAAPELLSCLRNLVGLISSGHPPGFLVTNGSLREAESAIAKAEGE